MRPLTIPILVLVGFVLFTTPALEFCPVPVWAVSRSSPRANTLPVLKMFNYGGEGAGEFQAINLIGGALNLIINKNDAKMEEDKNFLKRYGTLFFTAMRLTTFSTSSVRYMRSSSPSIEWGRFTYAWRRTILERAQSLRVGERKPRNIDWIFRDKDWWWASLCKNLLMEEDPMGKVLTWTRGRLRKWQWCET